MAIVDAMNIVRTVGLVVVVACCLLLNIVRTVGLVVACCLLWLLLCIEGVHYLVILRSKNAFP